MKLNSNHTFNRYSSEISFRIPVQVLGVLLAVLVFTACSDDPLEDALEVELSGVLVANEGNFSEPDGSLTQFDPENGQVIQQKFEQANNRELAGIIQSVVRGGERLYIVTNNINKVEVVDAQTLESLETITFDNGLTPAGFAFASESKGYISDLFGNSVAVLNLETYEVTDTRIDVGMAPQDMVVSSGRLFVANSGFGDDQTVSVIDIDADEVVSTIEVGNNPVQLTIDSQERIWVVSHGKRAFEESENDIPGRIDVIDSSTLQLIATVETGGFPTALTLSEELDLAWVVNEDRVHQIELSSINMLDESFISRSFNGIGYSTVENRLYLAHSRGFVQAGQAIIYDLEGAAVDSFQVGIAPFDFLFQVEGD